MIDFVETFSTSKICTLDENFDFSENYIIEFLNDLSKNIQKYIEEELKNYHEFKDFLGKKRIRIEEEKAKEYNKKNIMENLNEKFDKSNDTNTAVNVKNNDNSSSIDNKTIDLDIKRKIKENTEDISKDNDIKIKEQKTPENEKYFKKKFQLKDLSIRDLGKYIFLKLKDANKLKLITIYKKPILIMEIYEENMMNINLINDSIFFKTKYEELCKYDIRVYSLDYESRVIYDKTINLDNSIKPIDINNENIIPYLVIMKSKIPLIETFDLKLENIFPKEEVDINGKIYPKNISKIFFYYFNISSELQEKFEYINSKNRENLFGILNDFLANENQLVIIICGSKGIGKTTSLIKFSFMSCYNIFYFNLEIFNKYKCDENQSKELKIQLTKLFGKYIIYDSEKNIKKKIEDYIDDKKHRNKNGLEFIYNIIELFMQFTDELITYGTPFCFIIDQYSVEFKTDDEYDIDKIIDKIQKYKKIKLIICPSINNDFVKEQINFIFSQAFPSQRENIYFFQELISKDQMINNILNNENKEYLNFMEEIGFIPKLYYDSKLTNFDVYRKFLKNNLQKNLNEYIKNDREIIQNNTDLLNLLDIVKCERLISITDLVNNISKMPLKYLKIVKYEVEKDFIIKYCEKLNKNKKEDILLKYILYLFNNVQNDIQDRTFDNYFIIEERDIKVYLDNYSELDNDSKNIFGNYYEKYLENNTKLINLALDQKVIYLYQLEFSLFLFEDIIYEYLFNNLKKEYNFFRNFFDKGSNGGFFEILVDYYIKSSKSFIVNDIKKIFYIPSIVPHNYSIKYYSSKRKKDKFVEFKLKEKKPNEKKKKIPFENAYIKQTIFNSKYYDMCILIKTSNELNGNTFDIVVIQASIRKESGKRMDKDEHELILGIVKQNIENEFDIKIRKAYFIYVLSQRNKQIEDQDTKKECDNKGIAYLGFDIDAMYDLYNEKNINKYIIDLSKAFITELFPVHNSASLLFFPKSMDDMEDDYLELKNMINNNLNDLKQIENNDFEIIKKIFKNKYENKDISINQFKYFDLKITKNIRDIIPKCLTEFSFLIANKKYNNKYSKISCDCMFALGKGIELKNFNEIKEFKIRINSVVKFFYCEIPLKFN